MKPMDLESHLFDLGDRVVTPLGEVGIVVGLWLMPSGSWGYRLSPGNRHSGGVGRAWWQQDVLTLPEEVGIEG
jgi:hypothetical protein